MRTIYHCVLKKTQLHHYQAEEKWRIPKFRFAWNMDNRKLPSTNIITATDRILDYLYLIPITDYQQDRLNLYTYLLFHTNPKTIDTQD